MSPTPRGNLHAAMSLGTPPRVPVMCQLAIGHTLLQSGADPVDYLVSSATYADALLEMRERYRFDGVLLHKPGRDPWFAAVADRIDRAADVPTILLPDGAKIECRRDDDPYYVPAAGLSRPQELSELDPGDPFGWAPESFRHWCGHLGTSPAIPAHWFAAIDRVRERVRGEYAIHGETRSPLDHLVAIFGLQPTLMALLTEPERARVLLGQFTRWCVAWATAQIDHGCDAIKISSPYAGAGFISREMYREFVAPNERVIADAVRARGAFVYTHTCGAIGDRLDLMVETGVNGIEALDPPPLGTVDLALAKQQLRDKLFIKGNVNPVGTLLEKDVRGARADIARVYAVGSAGGQFILSTACSVAPRTPAENVKQLAECVEAHGGG